MWTRAGCKISVVRLYFFILALSLRQPTVNMQGGHLRIRSFLWFGFHLAVGKEMLCMKKLWQTGICCLIDDAFDVSLILVNVDK